MSLLINSTRLWAKAASRVTRYSVLHPSTCVGVKARTQTNPLSWHGYTACRQLSWVCPKLVLWVQDIMRPRYWVSSGVFPLMTIWLPRCAPPQPRKKRAASVETCWSQMGHVQLNNPEESKLMINSLSQGNQCMPSRVTWVRFWLSVLSCKRKRKQTSLIYQIWGHAA
jgi:hypothetical protein